MLRTAPRAGFPGHHAQVGIKIPAFIYPTHFTIDYVPFEVAAGLRQAPRETILWGVLDGPDNEARYKEASEAFKISPALPVTHPLAPPRPARRAPPCQEPPLLHT